MVEPCLTVSVSMFGAVNGMVSAEEWDSTTMKGLSFAIGASTSGLVEPPLTLRVACCNSKSRRVLEGLLPSMIRFWLQRFCMNPSQLHS